MARHHINMQLSYLYDNIIIIITDKILKLYAWHKMRYRRRELKICRTRALRTFPKKTEFTACFEKMRKKFLYSILSP